LSRSQEVAARIDTLTAGIQNVQRELQRNREREKRCNPLPEHSNILQYYHLAKTPAHKNALLKSLLEKVVYFRAEAGRWKPCQLELHLYPKVSSSVVAQRMMVPTNWPTWR
jgi:superfamily II DNA/RNA helicase